VQSISGFFAEARVKRPSALFVVIRESGRARDHVSPTLSFIRELEGLRGVITEAYRANSLRRVGHGGRTALDSPSSAP
jgi:hypothetical protein